ncbi:hypothetical protein [Shewanella xiamenensis]|uniref:hypothetical protein n=1 Tax=Shewanella xiamenensis TaxID=332186 RepID=UPI00313F3281
MTQPLSPDVLEADCSWTIDKICYITHLLNDENQYVTWVLVLAGWILTILIAIIQNQKSRKTIQNTSHNEWIKEFRDKLETLEDEALYFWTSKNNNYSDTLTFLKFTRIIKEITTIATDIQKVGGVKYQGNLFKELRQAVTNDNDLNERPLTNNNYRITAIKHVCSKLRAIYRRDIY